jgi:predicted  nucleic acid-binding Zn-ribbon protein
MSEMIRPKCRCCARIAPALLLTVLAAGSLPAQDPPLRQRVDALTAAHSAGIAAPIVSDAEFLRRAALDLTGMPPTVEELRAFLADPTPNKRELAVDRLLASPLHVRHLATTLDVLLMERRGAAKVSQDEWFNYLVQSVRDDKPWNQLVREMLSTDGADPNLRPAVRFALDRGAEPNLLTRDVGRIFFGRDMQCAQCHDHPLIDDYLQSDYHGLYAFVAPGFEQKIKEGDKETVYYSERAGSDVQFESVFVKGTKHITGARVVGGAEIAEPVFLPGEEYAVEMSASVRPQPKFSRRAQLAELTTNGSNPAFNENIANRLWAHLMGRGLVHPVDLHHSGNPPTHPELLKLLGEQFAAGGFRIRPFLRELALTQAYQRSIDRPGDLLAKSAEAAALVPQLEAQREALVAKAKESAAAYEQAIAAWNAAEAVLLPVVGEHDQARGKYAEVLKKVKEVLAALADAQNQLTAKQGIAQTVGDASAKAQEAVQKLPQDQELAAAAQKFAERAGQLTNEVAALQRTVEEKSAATTGPKGELDAARPVVEGAQQKVAPLKDAVRQQEQALLAVRRQMTADQTALAQFDQRLAMMRLLASVKLLEDKAVASAGAIASRQAELHSAQGQVTEYGAVVTQHQNEVAGAEQARAGTAEALAKVQQEHAQQAEVAKSVADAFAGAEAARTRLPNDAALIEAAQKLKGKSDELAAALAEHQKLVDVAAADDKSAAEKVAATKQSLDAVMAEKARREQAVATGEAALAVSRSQAETDRGAVNEAQAALTEKWSGDFTVAPLKPLTAEQLCWSIFRVTGVYERYRQAEIAELDKAAPLSDADKQDPAKLAARARDIEQKTFDKLKGNVGAFVAIYAAGAGQPQGDFFATADQALFAANGGSILSWVAPATGNVTEKIVNEVDPRKAAEDLYLTVLSRMPSEEEVADVTGYLASRASEKAAAAQELAWGLVASAEFRFNH